MNRRLMLLSAVALGLVGVVLADQGGLLSLFRAERQDVPPAPDVVAAAPGQARPPVQLNPLEALDANAFTVMLERPLFNPSRAARPPAPPPPPPEETVAETPPEPVNTGPDMADFKLLAVSSGPQGKVAALRRVSSGEVLYLREGQPLDGWSVLAIAEKSIAVGTAETSVELRLFDDEGSGASSAGPAEPAAQAPSGEDLPPYDPSTEQMD